jgi:hypothetical protein
MGFEGVEIPYSSKQVFRPYGGFAGVDIPYSYRQVFRPFNGFAGVETEFSGVKVLSIQNEQGVLLPAISVLVEDVDGVDSPIAIDSDVSGYVFLSSTYSNNIKVTIVDQLLYMNEVDFIDTSTGDYHNVTLIKAFYYRIKITGGTYSDVVKSNISSISNIITDSDSATYSLPFTKKGALLNFQILFSDVVVFDTTSNSPTFDLSAVGIGNKTIRITTTDLWKGTNGTLNLSNKALQSFNTNLITKDISTLNLNSNDLADAATIDRILLAVRKGGRNTGTRVLTIGRGGSPIGTNATPTGGAANANLIYLVNVLGYTVTWWNGAADQSTL